MPLNDACTNLFRVCSGFRAEPVSFYTVFVELPFFALELHEVRLALLLLGEFWSTFYS